MNNDPSHLEGGPAPSEPADLPGSTPLDRVIDDLEPKEAWFEWAVDEMAKGRCPEELAAEMVAQGWGEEDAAELVETARRRTRHLRGVITRDEVARENAARYHKATALNWFSMFRTVSTTFVCVTSVRNLLYSLSELLSSRRRATKAPGFPVQPSGPPSDTATVESREPSAPGPTG